VALQSEIARGRERTIAATKYRDLQGGSPLLSKRQLRGLPSQAHRPEFPAGVLSLKEKRRAGQIALGSRVWLRREVDVVSGMPFAAN
jgi:hypothetical protein